MLRRFAKLTTCLGGVTSIPSRFAFEPNFGPRLCSRSLTRLFGGPVLPNRREVGSTWLGRGVVCDRPWQAHSARALGDVREPRQRLLAVETRTCTQRFLAAALGCPRSRRQLPDSFWQRGRNLVRWDLATRVLLPLAWTHLPACYLCQIDLRPARRP